DRFNPCSRGCFARRTKALKPVSPSHVSILVLVDVSLEGHPRLPGPPAPLVSILVLVDVSLEAQTVYCVCQAVKFQSLFSWMFRSKSGLTGTITRHRCFNPCSRGC